MKQATTELFNGDRAILKLFVTYSLQNNFSGILKLIYEFLLTG
ncbi:hypothetical protein [Xenococcus sp. PCC 7305]|nr:hypothetical protein [Xenococcus sp. PCC 7305]